MRLLDISAVIATGVHLFPFRTEKLSPLAPMVLGEQSPGRVGRRRLFFRPRGPRKRVFWRSRAHAAPGRLVVPGAGRLQAQVRGSSSGSERRRMRPARGRRCGRAQTVGRVASQSSASRAGGRWPACSWGPLSGSHGATAAWVGGTRAQQQRGPGVGLSAATSYGVRLTPCHRAALSDGP